MLKFLLFFFFNLKKFTLVYFVYDIFVLVILLLTNVLSESINIMVRYALKLN